MYFGRAKAACLCSYCCNRHLCYDGGRLGRVKIVKKERRKRGEGRGKKITLFVVYSRPFALKAAFRAILKDFEFTVPIIKLGTVNSELKLLQNRSKNRF